MRDIKRGENISGSVIRRRYENETRREEGETMKTTKHNINGFEMTIKSYAAGDCLILTPNDYSNIHMRPEEFEALKQHLKSKKSD